MRFQFAVRTARFGPPQTRTTLWRGLSTGRGKLSWKDGLNTTKDNCIVIMRKSGCWLKKWVIILSKAMKEALHYHGLILRRGLQDKLVAIQFSGAVLGWCYAIGQLVTHLEEKLSSIENHMNGDASPSKIVQNMQWLSLKVLRCLKKILLLVGSGEVKEMRSELSCLSSEMKKVVHSLGILSNMVNELSVRTAVLQDENEQLRARMSKLELVDKLDLQKDTDAVVSKTYPQQAGTIHQNGFIVIKGRPCKVVEVSTSNTSGHSQCHFMAADIFNGQRLEIIIPSSENCDVPHVSCTDYQLIGISEDGFVSLLTSDGNTKDGLKLPTDEQLLKQIKDGFEEGKGLVLTVQSAMGEEQICALKDKPE